MIPSMSQVGLPELSIVTWILAVFPIILVLILMMKFKMSGARSGVLAWVVTLVIVAITFGGSINIMASGSAKGVWATFFVLFIIWSSMYLYNLVNSTGSFKVIAAMFTRLTAGNRLLQLLILGWVFPSFIQGVCGFGVPVAVSAPLLVGLGFNPMLAVITPLLGHSWGITFGSLGASYAVLVQLSPVEPGRMAWIGGIFIAFGGLLTGFAICHNYAGFKGIAQGLPAIIVLQGVMGGVLIVFCRFVSPYVATFAAGACGLIIGSIILPKLPMYKPAPDAEPVAEDPEVAGKSFIVAFSAYIILICVVFAAYLIPPLKKALEQPQFILGLPFPETSISYGYTNAATAKYSGLKIFTTPGMLIVVSSVLAAMFYKMKGLLPEGAIGASWQNTVKQSIGATTTIIPLTMMAVLMTEAGMTSYIAYGIAIVTGKAFPIFAPFIAILGGFVTSSGTSSNILFTGLQYQVATVLGISPYVVLAMQTTASSLSNSFSPGNCALGCGVTGQTGKEGEVLKVTGVYNAVQGFAVGILGWIMCYVFGVE